MQVEADGNFDSRQEYQQMLGQAEQCGLCNNAPVVGEIYFQVGTSSGDSKIARQHWYHHVLCPYSSTWGLPSVVAKLGQ